MSYRDTASFGKRQEFIAIAELIRRGFDVYLTLVDDQGIDCVIRINENCYIDVQIKARSKETKNPNHFGPYLLEPRKNYIYILYMEPTDTYFILPTEVMVKISQRYKSGANKGKYSIKIPKTDRSSKWKTLEMFKNDKGFKILNNIREKGTINWPDC